MKGPGQVQLSDVASAVLSHPALCSAAHEVFSQVNVSQGFCVIMGAGLPGFFAPRADDARWTAAQASFQVSPRSYLTFLDIYNSPPIISNSLALR